MSSKTVNKTEYTSLDIINAMPDTLPSSQTPRSDTLPSNQTPSSDTLPSSKTPRLDTLPSSKTTRPDKTKPVTPKCDFKKHKHKDYQEDRSRP